MLSGWTSRWCDREMDAIRTPVDGHAGAFLSQKACIGEGTCITPLA